MKYCTLSHYITIEVKGIQGPQFLQGQMTNNVLRDNQTLFCNIKGRIIAMIQVIYDKQNLFLLMNKACWPKTFSLLEKTAQLSRVEFQERPDLPVYGILHENDAYISLSATGKAIDLQTWHQACLLQKKFELYPETIGKFLPHDLGLEQHNWIDFKKGCYRGQEIIARMHYLGKSKYHLELIANDDSNTLSPGMPIYQGQSLIGELVDFNKDYQLVCVKQVSS
jgi:tRNA-modifying protein YgfZ